MDKLAGTVGLMADPGLPTRIAQRLADDVAKELSDVSSESWEVQVSQQQLPLNAEGEIPVFYYAERLRKAHSWDYLVYLTDLPLIEREEIVLCQASADAQTVMLSVPAVGAFRVTARVRALVIALISSAQENTFDYPSERLMNDIMGHRHVRRYADSDDDDIVTVFLSGKRTLLELAAGMIRSNQPWKLLPALTSSMALGAATGAFGIFYGSIWDLSDALPSWRLLLISIAVTATLGIWLIAKNGLWARGGSPAVPWQSRLDNTATVVTIGLGVTQVHIVLLGVLFVLGLVVIDKNYLGEQLDHAVGIGHYFQLSWLSASLGTLAGALGSNFNSEEAIREATYSRRAYERRKLADSFDDSNEANE